MTLEQRLDDFLKQPGAVVTEEELIFIHCMRWARSQGVGYGWMQQVIEWEWQSKDPIGSWGPERYESERRAP